MEFVSTVHVRILLIMSRRKEVTREIITHEIITREIITRGPWDTCILTTKLV